MVTGFIGGFYLRDLRVCMQNNNMVAYMKSAFSLRPIVRTCYIKTFQSLQMILSLSVIFTAT